MGVMTLQIKPFKSVDTIRGHYTPTMRHEGRPHQDSETRGDGMRGNGEAPIQWQGMRS
jgi:hypothetical protein